MLSMCEHFFTAVGKASGDDLVNLVERMKSEHSFSQRNGELIQYCAKVLIGPSFLYVRFLRSQTCLFLSVLEQ